MTGKNTVTGSSSRYVFRTTSDDLYRALASSITSIVYGTASTNRSLDDILERIFEVVHDISNAAGKDRHLVELFPSMLLLPDWLATWKRDGAASYRKYSALFEGFYEDARDSMVCFIPLIMP